MIQALKKAVMGGWEDGLSPAEEKKRFWLCLAFVFFWGLLAHAYGFLQDSFSHDVLNALYADGVETFWKMQLGRFFAVLYRRSIRGALTLPWLIGLLALLWLSLAVFFTARLLRIRSRSLLFVTAGVFVANLTVTALTATYIYELDIDLFAMLAAVIAAFLWARYGWVGCLLGACFVAGTLGLYQSYLSVAIVLVMLSSMLSLLDGEGFLPVLRKGLRGILMLLLGGGLYYALLRLMMAAKNIVTDTGSYNSVYAVFSPAEGAPGLGESLRAVYQNWADSFLDPAAAHVEPAARLLHLLLLALLALLVLLVLFRGRQGWAEKALLLVLLALLPFGCNVTRLLSGRDVHDLMKYAFWLSYLAVLLLSRWAAENLTLPRFPAGKAAHGLCLLLCALLLWGNVQTANAAYVKKDLEQEATLSLMTRVLYRLEAQPDYVPGETPLVFAGAAEQLAPAVYGFDSYRDITGLEAPTAIPTANAEYYYNAYAAYFRYILNTPANFCEHRLWNELQLNETVQAMPAYPAEGCLRMVDGVMVVKMGDLPYYTAHTPGSGN